MKKGYNMNKIFLSLLMIVGIFFSATCGEGKGTGLQLMLMEGDRGSVEFERTIDIAESCPLKNACYSLEAIRFLDGKGRESSTVSLGKGSQMYFFYEGNEGVLLVAGTINGKKYKTLLRIIGPFISNKDAYGVKAMNVKTKGSISVIVCRDKVTIVDSNKEGMILKVDMNSAEKLSNEMIDLLKQAVNE